MRVTLLDEPPLEFHNGGRHIDPRHGITDYGPADLAADAPRLIRLGVVGSQASIDGIRRWLESSRRPISAKDSHLGNLFFPFPGFDTSAGFHSILVFDSRLERSIAERDLNRLNGRRVDEAVNHVVGIYLAELELLEEEPACDVVIVARPDRLQDTARRDEPQPEPSTVDFHSLLKARTLTHSRPLQILRRTTWDPTFKDPTIPGRSQQDVATRAWNLHTALYYKAGGVPWRLPRTNTDLTSCYVGVSFYRPVADEDVLQTSVAQIFNQRGDGMIIRGGPAQISKDDRQPHLTEDAAHGLLTDSLRRYKAEHRNLPARIVIHKSSRFIPEETAGFTDAASDLMIDQIELVWISNSSTLGRLYRSSDYPPLRGTAMINAQGESILYTRGSVPFYRTYPGMYVPEPISVRPALGGLSPEHMCEEALALTKMNWNQTQLDTRLPITLETSRRVGAILRQLPHDSTPATRYAYYM